MPGAHQTTRYPHGDPFNNAVVVTPEVNELARLRNTVIPRRPIGASYRSRTVQRPITTKDYSNTPHRIRGLSNTSLSKKEKRFGMVDPAVWESVTRSLSQQHRLSSLVTPDQSPRPPSVDGPSRSSSQRKRLDHFTKDLQKYASATGAQGRLLVIPSTATESRSIQ